MARTRIYAAEYAARQARSQAQYGVSYNQQRRVVEKAKAQGLTAASARRVLTETKSAKVTNKVLNDRAQAKADYAAGRDVDWDIGDYDAYDFDDEWLFYH